MHDSNMSSFRLVHCEVISLSAAELIFVNDRSNFLIAET
jgi:hypothetical protein